MKLEKPISSIRQAIKTSAEKTALLEKLITPEIRHFESALNSFKILRFSNPQKLQNILNVFEKGKKLKEELGPELDFVFQKVNDEVLDSFEEFLIFETEKINAKSNLTQDERAREKLTLIFNSFNLMLEKVRNDRRIISAFSGKELLLHKAINYMEESLPKLIED
ncbi:MAG TPA: hypothetical protein PLN13_13575 [Bacteroidia bacterium]|nr:hypothetical protein [Bacteroidia bacterium]HRH09606.1 hypothetical protein [Bacteroidia bacterium]